MKHVFPIPTTVDFFRFIVDPTVSLFIFKMFALLILVSYTYFKISEIQTKQLLNIIIINQNTYVNNCRG